MPTYEYECDRCGWVEERERPAARRDDEVACPNEHGPMRRLMAAGMTVTWAGKFHSPWAKKKDGEW